MLLRWSNQLNILATLNCPDKYHHPAELSLASNHITTKTCYMSEEDLWNGITLVEPVSNLILPFGLLDCILLGTKNQLEQVLWKWGLNYGRLANHWLWETIFLRRLVLFDVHTEECNAGWAMNETHVPCTSCSKTFPLSALRSRAGLMSEIWRIFSTELK